MTISLSKQLKGNYIKFVFAGYTGVGGWGEIGIKYCCILVEKSLETKGLLSIVFPYHNHYHFLSTTFVSLSSYCSFRTMTEDKDEKIFSCHEYI